MQIVIDIDESYVRIINKNGASNYPEEVIKNGTPLPKGHGRLIDADELYDSLIFPTEQFARGYKGTLDSAPTIIEADTESEGKG